jgi:glycine cleavage system aminomethyltransferase T
MDEGEKNGIVDWGYRALDSMRLEKGYRLWGEDMSADWTPLQAGMGRFVDFDKGDFLGRDALVRENQEGPQQVLACLVIEADDADAQGFEPIFADGKPVAYIASGGYGHRVEKSIAYSYLPKQLAVPGTHLEVDLVGVRRPASVVEEALYDPEGVRLLS